MMKDYSKMTQEECNHNEESELSIAAEYIMDNMPDNLKSKLTKKDVVEILEMETDYYELKDIESECACDC
ncbi:MAG: hypothetical protein SOY73_14950 [Blautia sp.]|nr:hypothetical protein [Blautia sp.]